MFSKTFDYYSKMKEVVRKYNGKSTVNFYFFTKKKKEKKGKNKQNYKMKQKYNTEGYINPSWKCTSIMNLLTAIEGKFL